MKSVTLKSHAKINIFLHILGKRQDGYHDLYTLFAKVGLHDLLTVKHSEKQIITCTKPDIPTDERNIISKVDKILKNKGISENFHTHIEKNIPDGGGLGGGSSNAAAYLKAVLALTETEMSMAEQTEIMAAVGSDTAFFLHDEPMIGTGRGEVLMPYGKLPKAYVLLVNPGIHVSTPKVFSSPKLKLTDRAELNKIQQISVFDDFSQVLFNDMEDAVFDEYKEVLMAKEALAACGGLSLMSGSGATVFGLFRDRAGAENAEKEINSSRPAWKCFLTEII